METCRPAAGRPAPSFGPSFPVLPWQSGAGAPRRSVRRRPPCRVPAAARRRRGRRRCPTLRSPPPSRNGRCRAALRPSPAVSRPAAPSARSPGRGQGCRAAAIVTMCRALMTIAPSDTPTVPSDRTSQPVTGLEVNKPTVLTRRAWPADRCATAARSRSRRPRGS